MTRPVRRRARVAGGLALPSAALALLAFTACAASGAGAEPSATPTSTPDPTSAIVSIPMPDLAPYPDGGPPLTEAESEAKRVESADATWRGVLATYPQAVRPADPFAGYASEAERTDLLRACLEAAGVAIDEGRTSNPDDPPSMGWSTSNEAEAVAAFTCEVARPVQSTSPGPNAARLGWIYDYLVEFFAPCLEANGIEVEPPPGRDVWVETWPGYVWFPTWTGDSRFTNADMDAAIHEACPDPDSYLRNAHAAG